MSGPLYHTARWLRRRQAQLRNEPLCRYCMDRGEVTAATVVDHIIPHRGDPVLFWASPVQSLCATHHSGSKQREEHQGYSIEIGIDGYPIETKQPFSIPHNVRPSNIPVHLVCGAPGSGKTTFVKQHMQGGDLAIDLDDIRDALQNVTIHLMDTSRDECRRRIDADPLRAQPAKRFHALINEFFDLSPSHKEKKNKTFTRTTGGR